MSDDQAPLPPPPVKTGCIYKIRNTLNGKEYVGQTRLAPEVRWKQHRVRQHKHMIIGCAMRKYGLDAFTFSVVEDGIPIEKLNEREQFWVAELKTMSPSGYNATSGGGVNFTISDETREKHRLSMLGKPPRSIRVHTPESREHLRVLALARGKCPWLKHRRKKTWAKNLQTGEIIEFESRYDCAKHFSVSCGLVANTIARNAATFQKVWKIYGHPITP